MGNYDQNLCSITFKLLLWSFLHNLIDAFSFNSVNLVQMYM
jgi:hypothetical protein